MTSKLNLLRKLIREEILKEVNDDDIVKSRKKMEHIIKVTQSFLKSNSLTSENISDYIQSIEFILQSMKQ